MNNEIILVLGDWSDDGHGKTHTAMIKSNLTREELEQSYKLGTAQLTFNFQDTVASDYEDSTISRRHLEELVSKGFDPKVLDEYDEDEEDDDEPIDIWIDDYIQLWMFVAKLGNPSLEWEEFALNSIHIDGYGLFN